VIEFALITLAELAHFCFSYLFMPHPHISVKPNYDIDWSFESETIYLYGEGSNGGMEYQYIVIDTSNEITYVVYVITLLL
jgi:hypothetical protein